MQLGMEQGFRVQSRGIGCIACSLGRCTGIVTSDIRYSVMPLGASGRRKIKNMSPSRLRAF